VNNYCNGKESQWEDNGGVGGLPFGKKLPILFIIDGLKTEKIARKGLEAYPQQYYYICQEKRLYYYIEYVLALAIKNPSASFVGGQSRLPCVR
jgi:hypothetical protein